MSFPAIRASRVDDGHMIARVEADEAPRRDLDLDRLAEMTQSVPLARVFEIGEAILKGEVRGCVVVEID